MSHFEKYPIKDSLFLQETEFSNRIDCAKEREGKNTMKKTMKNALISMCIIIMLAVELAAPVPAAEITEQQVAAEIADNPYTTEITEQQDTAEMADSSYNEFMQGNVQEEMQKEAQNEEVPEEVMSDDSEDNAGEQLMEAETESEEEIVDSKEDTEPVAEKDESEMIQGQSVELDESKDVSTESDDTEEIEAQSDVEEIVGAGATIKKWTAGDKVTARLVKEGNKYIVYLESKGGTLWNTRWSAGEIWDSALSSEEKKCVNIIRVTDKSTKLYLQECFLIFAGFEYPNLEQIDLGKIDISRNDNTMRMFHDQKKITSLDLSSFNTKNIIYMESMFSGCESLWKLDLSKFNTSKVEAMSYMFKNCSSLRSLNLSNFNTSEVESMCGMFSCCANLESLDLSSFVISGNTDTDCMLEGCYSLKVLKTPKKVRREIKLPYVMFDESGKAYKKIPVGTGSFVLRDSAVSSKKMPVLSFKNATVYKTLSDKPFTAEFKKETDGTLTYKSGNTKVATVNARTGLVSLKGVGTTTITLTAAEGKCYKAGKTSFKLTVAPISIEHASVTGVSISYGYSGKEYKPSPKVKVNGVTLTKDTDYKVAYKNNRNPGTATITITGAGKYKGTRVRKFEIVDCESSLVSGRIYMFIPKNNTNTAVCTRLGRTVNNSNVYISNRNDSAAMRFRAVRNSDGTWKLIQIKSGRALAVQNDSVSEDAGIVIYDVKNKASQKWKLTKKSDNSFVITNAATGLFVTMSDKSAVRGTALNMKKTYNSGLQRFYVVEDNAPDKAGQ